MRYLVLDISSAPLPDAETYLEGSVRAPKNYGEDAAAKFIAEKQAERLQMAATDIDLARVTGYGLVGDGRDPLVNVLQDEAAERDALSVIGWDIAATKRTIITYGGFNFDLPLLMRRARYLGVDFPKLNLDRYRSPHLDLCELLSDRDFKRRRPLSFYVKRLSWTDLTKTLSGAEEARVHETGRWDDLAASLRHDVTATARLAAWMGLIELPQPTLAEVG